MLVRLQQRSQTYNWPGLESSFCWNKDEVVKGSLRAEQQHDDDDDVCVLKQFCSFYLYTEGIIQFILRTFPHFSVTWLLKNTQNIL